jgi:hypothetical protein
MRLIPRKPRVVRIWSGGVTPEEFAVAKPELKSFISNVEAGHDLTSHLSELVHTTGIVMQGASPTARRKDIDGVLLRNGLHHFHIGERRPGNPRGRSSTLIFAEVLENEFRIVALSDHRAFDITTSEHSRFFQICQAYTEKDIPADQPFMNRIMMSSGHPIELVLYSNRCEMEIERLNPCLDDPGFVTRLYDENPTDNHERLVPRPESPALVWHFEDLQFGVLERKTRAFFCILPFFAR